DRPRRCLACPWRLTAAGREFLMVHNSLGKNFYALRALAGDDHLSAFRQSTERCCVVEKPIVAAVTVFVPIRRARKRNLFFGHKRSSVNNCNTHIIHAGKYCANKTFMQ